MNKVLFPHTVWFLLLLIPFIIFGFFPGYFSKLPGPIDTVIHIHTTLMIVWTVMAIVQPYLILHKKVQLHRLVGKASYVVMPLLLISGYALLQYRYHRILELIRHDVAIGKVKFTPDEIYLNAASSLRLGLVYFILLATFYSLAVIHRKKFLQHATYMFAAILTLLGPSVDRIIGQIYKYYQTPLGLVAKNATLLFTIGLLTALSFYQYKKGNSVKPALISVAVYAIAFVVLNFLTKTKAWQTVVEIIL